MNVCGQQTKVMCKYDNRRKKSTQREREKDRFTVGWRKKNDACIIVVVVTFLLLHYRLNIIRDRRINDRIEKYVRISSRTTIHYARKWLESSIDIATFRSHRNNKSACSLRDISISKKIIHEKKTSLFEVMQLCNANISMIHPSQENVVVLSSAGSSWTLFESTYFDYDVIDRTNDDFLLKSMTLFIHTVHSSKEIRRMIFSFSSTGKISIDVTHHCSAFISFLRNGTNGNLDNE